MTTLGPTSRKILIIEDSPLVAEYAEMLLTEAGYQVVIAKDWIEANVLVFNREEHIDLILIDVNLGLCITGDKIAEVYKSRREKSNSAGALSNVGIYLFSSMDEAELEKLVKKTGVDGYIQKKEELAGLVDRVRAYFNEK